MNITEFIQRIAEELEIDEINLSAETNFKTLDEWSSISVMLLVAFFDEHFGKEVNAKVINKCNTLQELYELSNGTTKI